MYILIRINRLCLFPIINDNKHCDTQTEKGKLSLHTNSIESRIVFRECAYKTCHIKLCLSTCPAH